MRVTERGREYLAAPLSWEPSTPKPKGPWMDFDELWSAPAARLGLYVDPDHILDQQSNVDGLATRTDPEELSRLRIRDIGGGLLAELQITRHREGKSEREYWVDTIDGEKAGFWCTASEIATPSPERFRLHQTAATAFYPLVAPAIEQAKKLLLRGVGVVFLVADACETSGHVVLATLAEKSIDGRDARYFITDAAAESRETTQIVSEQELLDGSFLNRFPKEGANYRYRYFPHIMEVFLPRAPRKPEDRYLGDIL